MYTLRIVSKENVQHNYLLGKSYSLIHGYESEIFKEAVGSLPATYDEKEPHVHAVLIPEIGERHFLWSSEDHYIMTDNGKTFANLTLR